MSNTFVQDLVPRILPTTLETLREQLPLLGMVSKDYSMAASEIGSVVTVQRPQRLSVSQVQPAMIAPSPADLNPGFVNIPIQNWYKANFGLTIKEVMEIKEENIIPFQVKEAVRAVCKKISETVWATYPGISNLAGKAGTGAFASNSVAAAIRASYMLDLSLCPKDNRHLWLSLKDTMDLKSNTTYGQYIYVGQEPVGNNIIRDGALKSFFDLRSVNPDYTTPIHTVGAGFGGGTVAASGVNAAGATSIVVAVTGGSGLAMNAGDCVVIGTEAGLLRNTYSLTADAAVGAGTTGALFLNRGLETAKSSSEAITIATTDGSTPLGTSEIAIAGDPTGMGLVMRYPSAELMGNRTMYESMPLVDDQTGAILVLSFLGGYKMTSWEVSALWGTAVVDERKLARISSYTNLSV